MTVPRWLALLLACSAACSSDIDDPLGALHIALTTQAGGITYRLADARFTLEGDASRELTSSEEGELSVSLPPGAYRLVLREGFTLAPLDDAEARVGARLVSQNPLPIQIAAGETTRAVLRFELSGPRAWLDAGALPPREHAAMPSAIIDAAQVAPPHDAGTPASPTPSEAHCTANLRIDELDYEQPSADDAEFVEVVNAGPCDAPLAGVRLALINGTGNKPYGQYDLAAAGARLPAGARLVVGDEAILARLPASTLGLPLRGSGLQNGPDALRLLDGMRLLDAVAYGGTRDGGGQDTLAGDDDGAPALARCPRGRDADASDFHAVSPTPGMPNACNDQEPRHGDPRDGGAQNRSATMPSSSSQR
ncbi:MAG: lamin tail domain-containing protein [Polyangiales bacterium]